MSAKRRLMASGGPSYMVSQEAWELWDDFKVVFDFWYQILYVWRAFRKVIYTSCTWKIRYQDNFDLLNYLKIIKILQYLCQFCICKNGKPHFENLKTGVLNIRCLSWNNAIIVFMKNAEWIEDDKKSSLNSHGIYIKKDFYSIYV